MRGHFIGQGRRHGRGRASARAALAASLIAGLSVPMLSGTGAGAATCSTTPEISSDDPSTATWTNPTTGATVGYQTYTPNVSQGLPHNGAQSSPLAKDTSGVTNGAPAGFALNTPIPNPPLVQNKTTFVRFYMNLNPCMAAAYPNGASAQLSSSSTLTVRLTANGSTTVKTEQLLSIPTPVTATRPTDAATSDPVFVIPPGDLVPGSAASSWTVTFTPNLAYTTLITGTTQSFTGSTPVNVSTSKGVTDVPSSAVVGNSQPIRVLVVPMGDGYGAGGAASQFTTAGNQAVQDGMATINRLLPVHDVAGDLCPSPSTGANGQPVCNGSPTAAGIQYHINTNLGIDLGSGVHVNPSTGLPTTDPNSFNLLARTNGVFCLGLNDFTAKNIGGTKTLAQTLTDVLDMYNANNSVAFHADRVLGVYDPAISYGYKDSRPGSPQCASGLADPLSRHGIARADYAGGAGYNTNVPVEAGPTIAMELVHTMGLVPNTRFSNNAPHSGHSYLTNNGKGADWSDIIPKGFDITANPASSGVLLAPQSVTNVPDPGTKYTNTNSLLEQADWADTLCVLGGPLTDECSSTSSSSNPSLKQNGLGSAGLIGAAQLFMSGLTDETAGVGTFGSLITDSSESNNTINTTPEASGSHDRAVTVSVDSNGVRHVLSNVGFSASQLIDDHDSSGTVEGTPSCPPPYQAQPQPCKSFNFVINVDPSANNVELWNTSVMSGDPANSGASIKLATRNVGTRPVVTGINTTNLSPNSTVVNLTSGDAGADHSRPAISPDGRWLAYTRTPHNLPGYTCSEIVVTPYPQTNPPTYDYLPSANTTDPTDPLAPKNSLTSPAPQCLTSLPDQVALRPDMGAIAFVSNGNLYRIGFNPANASGSRFQGSAVVVYTCASVANAGGACVSSENANLLTGVARPSWSGYDWRPSGSAWRIAYDVNDVSGGRNVYKVDPYTATQVTVPNGGTLDVYPASLLAVNASQPSWSRQSGQLTSVAFTSSSNPNNSATSLSVVDANRSDALNRYTSTSLTCCGSQSGWGSRFLAAEMNNVSGTTGTIGLADMTSFDPVRGLQPILAATTPDGNNSWPSMTGSLPSAVTAFDGVLAFQHGAIGAQQDIEVLSLVTSDRRRVLIRGIVQDPNNHPARASGFVSCGGINEPFAVALFPTYQNQSTGQVDFEADLDHGNACGGTGREPTIGAVIDNGFLTSAFTTGGGAGTTPKDPILTILNPSNGDVMNPNTALHLYGSARDGFDFDLSDSIVWHAITASGNDACGTAGCVGRSIYVKAPSGGWGIGRLTVTGSVVNSSGRTTITNPGNGGCCGVIVDPPPPPPVASQAVKVLFDPDAMTASTPGDGGVITNSVSLVNPPAGRTLSQIPSISISSIGLPNQTQMSVTIKATSWDPVTGTAKFDKSAVSKFLWDNYNTYLLVNGPHRFWITLTGYHAGDPYNNNAGAWQISNHDTDPCIHLANQGATC